MLEQFVSTYTGYKGVTEPVYAVQGDTGRVLICRLNDYQLTGNEGASLICERPDKTVYTYTGTISHTLNTVSFELNVEGGALSQDGLVHMMVEITDDGAIVCSFPIEMTVIPVLGGEATEDEKTFVDALQEQLAGKADVASVVLKTRTINGKSLNDDVVLKAANFSEAITGQKLLANIEYQVVSTWS